MTEVRFLVHGVADHRPALAPLRMAPAGGDPEAELRDLAAEARLLDHRCRVVGAGLAGGAARIFGDPARDRSPELFETLAREVESRGGRVLLVKGAGVETADMEEIRRGTPHVLGLPVEAGGSGDPSPFTALGVLAAVRACLDDPSGKRVSVLGVGRVGSVLVGLLAAAGAKVTVADADAETARRVAAEHGAAVATVPEILAMEGDLLSPNGRGEVLDLEAADSLRYRFVAGAANGQIRDERIEARLAGRGVVYVPEVLAGSGWLVNLATEVRPGGYSRSIAWERCLGLETRVREFLGILVERGGPASEAVRAFPELSRC
jgi:leucine dehydrogenase